MDAVKQLFGEGSKHRVVLYIPGTLAGQQEMESADHERWVRLALRTMSIVFGGATALKAQGSWLTPQGELTVETVTLVYSFTDTLSILHLRTVYQFAHTVRAELSQDSVAVEIDGELHLI